MSEQQPQPPHPWMLKMGFKYHKVDGGQPGEPYPIYYWLLGDELGPWSISCGLDENGEFVDNWSLGEHCIENIGTRDTIALLALSMGLITYEKFEEIYNQ